MWQTVAAKMPLQGSTSSSRRRNWTGLRRWPWTSAAQLSNKVGPPHTNARAKSINAGIQWLKYSARSFRNLQRFRNAIYFHFGGLNLYPKGDAR